jgi:hypothetical protein
LTLICNKLTLLNRKWLPLIMIVVLALLVLAIKKWQNDRNPSHQPKTDRDRTEKNTGKTVNRDRGFDRRTSYLKYSNHAKCRMECRRISPAEVEEIMEDGKINYNKSDLQNKRCPRYALEGTTRDDQRVRIVYAQCNESTTVVTVIDLDTDWTCDCRGNDGRGNDGPGDDGPSSPSKNKL